MGDVFEFSGQSAGTQKSNLSLTGELNVILSLLREACPSKAQISFDFDGQLHVHVDVRNLAEVSAVEAVLPTLADGIFIRLTRGATPHHPFLHRVSALVGG